MPRHPVRDGSADSPAWLERAAAISWRLLVVGAAGFGVVFVLDRLGWTVSRGPALHAFGQAWPPFALVTGLLLIGVTAHRDGVFAAAADRMSGLRVGTVPLFILAMALVAAVTVVLTLDSAVLFLTPILVAVAHRRGIDDGPFLYGCVFMANAASLLLPGANLTNLLVFAHEPDAGSVFAARMFPAWAAAVVVTGVVVMAAYRRSLSAASVATTERTAVTSPVSSLAIVVAAGLVVALREPALPVLGVGLVVAAFYVGTGRLAGLGVIRSLNVPLLAGLFAATVALGTLARVWTGPSDLVGWANRPVTLMLSVLGAAVLNNLPAATLLSAEAPAHPRMLLLGLNVGPNLVASGSLAGILWLRLGRASGGRPSVRRFSAIGIVLVPLTLAAASGALAVTAGL